MKQHEGDFKCGMNEMHITMPTGRLTITADDACVASPDPQVI